MSDKLSIKEQSFVDGLLEGLSGAEAYRRAGYVAANPKVAGTCASQLLVRPRVRDAVEAGRVKKESSAIANREEQEAFLTKVLRAEVTDTALTKEGPVAVPAALRDRIKATEQLGKRQGHFAPEVHEVNGSFGVRVAAVVANLKKQA